MKVDVTGQDGVDKRSGGVGSKVKHSKVSQFSTVVLNNLYKRMHFTLMSASIQARACLFVPAMKSA